MLKVSPITDFDAIAKIYQCEGAKRIGHDFRKAEPIRHPAARYYGAYLNDHLIGVFLRIDSNFIDVDMHALLLPAALPYSRQFGRLMLAEIFKDSKIQRITAQIIEGLETAVNYCRKLGFQREGFKRNACMKDGRLVGVHFLGITRSDWEAI